MYLYVQEVMRCSEETLHDMRKSLVKWLQNGEGKQ